MKQKNIPWLGALLEAFQNTLPFLGIVNFISIMTVLYATIREHLLSWFPWLTFGYFIIITICIGLVGMLIVHLVVVPSLWSYRNKQMNKFESDIMEKLKELEEEIKKK